MKTTVKIAVEVTIEVTESDPVAVVNSKRFRDKYVVNPVTGCHEWVAGATDAGRGRYWLDGRYQYPYRVACAAEHGPAPEAPEGQTVVAAHGCDNPRCVNGQHMAWKTQSENMNDCVERGRHASQVAKIAARAAGIAARRLEQEVRAMDRELAEMMRAG
jgi:hypothetical protein